MAGGRRRLPLEHIKVLSVRLWDRIAEKCGSFEKLKQLLKRKNALTTEVAVRGWMPPIERLREARDGSTVSEEEWEKVFAPDLAPLREIAGILDVSVDYLLGLSDVKTLGEKAPPGVLATTLAHHVWRELVRRRPGRGFVGDIAQVMGADVKVDLKKGRSGIPSFLESERFLAAVVDWTEREVRSRTQSDDATESETVRNDVVDLLSRVHVLDGEHRAATINSLMAAHDDPLSTGRQADVCNAAELIHAAEEGTANASATSEVNQAEADAGDQLLAFIVEDLLPDLAKLDGYNDAPFTCRQAGRRLARAAAHPTDAQAMESVYEIFDALYAIEQFEDGEAELWRERKISQSDLSVTRAAEALGQEDDYYRSSEEREFHGPIAIERDKQGQAELEAAHLDLQWRGVHRARERPSAKRGRQNHDLYIVKDANGEVVLDASGKAVCLPNRRKRTRLEGDPTRRRGDPTTQVQPAPSASSASSGAPA